MFRSYQDMVMDDIRKSNYEYELKKFKLKKKKQFKLINMKGFIAALLFVIACAMLGTVIVKKITLTQNCTGYLKRAADANSVETAKAELNKAISYLEANQLTTGYTSVLWRTPDEDIEFFYQNLKASELELSKVTETTSSLEKTNILMKLRETLLDNGEKGDSLTYPDGLSRYPNNGFWGIITLLGVGIIIFLIIWALIELES